MPKHMQQYSQKRIDQVCKIFNCRIIFLLNKNCLILLNAKSHKINKNETHIRNKSKNPKCIYINMVWEEKTITIHVSHKNLNSCFLQNSQFEFRCI